MLPLHEDPHFTFCFADGRIIPRFHLEGFSGGNSGSIRAHRASDSNGLAMILPPDTFTREFNARCMPLNLISPPFLKQFKASSPDLLRSIAAEQTLDAVISMNDHRNRRLKVKIGGYYVNAHTSAAQLQDWCRKIAKIGKIGVDDFEFVMPENAAKIPRDKEE